jgi:hypothetical protein
MPPKNSLTNVPDRFKSSAVGSTNVALHLGQWNRKENRRYTRLSNGFSRKLANHAAATALNYFAYNFIKIHRSLRTSPAMAAGVTDRLWSVEDFSGSLQSLRAAEGGKSGVAIDEENRMSVSGHSCPRSHNH